MAVIVVLAVGGAALVFWPRGTTAISEEDALEDFRGAQAQDAADTADATTGTPALGVYPYAAEGEESVKLGPLPTETRPFPATITGVAANAVHGCFTWTVNFFVEHTEETRYCVVDDALRLDQHVKHQVIGALSPTATMVCDPALLLVPDTPSVDLSCELTLDGGPASIHATVTGTATTGRAETLTIGGQEAQATPVVVRYQVTGDLSGSWIETTWWTTDLLPVRIERDIDLRGPATFTEASKLQLVSLAPAT